MHDAVVISQNPALRSGVGEDLVEVGVAVEPGDDDRVAQQQVDELVGAVQRLVEPRTGRPVLQREAVVVAEDQDEALFGLGLLELGGEPAELVVGHRAVGPGDLVAGVEAEHPHVRREVGLPPRLAGVEVALREPVPDRARRAGGPEVLGHELALLEQEAGRVGRDVRRPERRPCCWPERVEPSLQHAAGGARSR